MSTRPMVGPWGMVHRPIFLKQGHVGRLAPPFWPDFLVGSRRSPQSAGPLEEKPARRYAPSKIWPDPRHSEGSEQSWKRKLRPYERSRCAEHGGCFLLELQPCVAGGVRPTGGSHGRIARGPAQRWAKPGRKARRPRLRGYKGAAKGIIEAGGRQTPSPGGALVWPPLCLS